MNPLTVSVDVPTGFTDGDTRIDGGLRHVDIETATRWAADGRCKALQSDAAEASPLPEPEPVVEAAWQGKVPRATPTVGVVEPVVEPQPVPEPVAPEIEPEIEPEAPASAVAPEEAL